MSYPSQRLVAEHDLIKRMLAVVNNAAAQLESGKNIEPKVFLQAVDFIRNFADGFHHAKEEDILFKVMQERGIPVEGGPIGVMLSEHDHGRNFTKGIEDAVNRVLGGDESAKQDIIGNAKNYTQLLSNHIHKEDNILYPMGNNVFSTEDQQFIEKEFDRVEKETIGEDIYQKYLNIVEDLEKQFA
jgi:hemerythrin-like domain-containing protein